MTISRAIHQRVKSIRMSWTMQLQCMSPKSMADTLSGARCVNGFLMRPMPAEEEPPSTACRPNVANAPGGVVLGRGPPGFGQCPGSVPSRQIAPPPPPPPPPPAPVPYGHAVPVQPPIQGNGHHYIRGPRRQEEAVHQMVQEEAQGLEWETSPIQQAMHN